MLLLVDSSDKTDAATLLLERVTLVAQLPTELTYGKTSAWLLALVVTSTLLSNNHLSLAASAYPIYSILPKRKQDGIDWTQALGSYGQWSGGSSRHDPPSSARWKRQERVVQRWFIANLT